MILVSYLWALVCLLCCWFSLSAMLFGFSLEQRNRQVGLFRSLGYTQKELDSSVGWKLGLSVWLEPFGCGMVLVFWSSNPMDAQRCLGGSGCPNDPDIFPDLESVIGGVLGSFLMGVITLSFVSRRQLKKSPTELLQSGEFIRLSPKRRTKMIPFSINLWGEGLLWICALVLWLLNLSGTFPGPSYFGIGALA